MYSSVFRRSAFVAEYLFHKFFGIDHIFFPFCHFEIAQMGGKNDAAGSQHAYGLQQIMTGKNIPLPGRQDIP